jgi:hypothetical protein
MLNRCQNAHEMISIGCFNVLNNIFTMKMRKIDEREPTYSNRNIALDKEYKQIAISSNRFKITS